MNSPVVFNSEQLTILNTLNQKYLSGEILSFNDSNVASDASSVTLDTLSGVVTCTTTIAAAPSVTTMTILNSLVTSSTVVNAFIVGTSLNNTYATICGVFCATGSIKINLTVVGGTASTSTKIGFLIMNP